MKENQQRYARQQVFAPIGVKGQERLATSCVAIVGIGALGTHLADMLARAGVGKLLLVDRDIVEWSNLQRQVLFDEADARAGVPKATAAAERLRQINTTITIEARVQDLGPDEARDLVDEADLVLDGSDSFETRYLINDACVAAGKPWIYSAVVGAEGMTLNCHIEHSGERTPCLRCVWPEPASPGTAATCDTVGVVNGAVAVVSGMAATEALKVLVGDANVSGELRSFDLWQGNFDALAVPRDPECPTCGHGEYEWLDGDRAPSADRLCGRETVQVRPDGRVTIDLTALAARWQPLGAVHLAPGGEFARLMIDPEDLTVFRDGRALIRGTDDLAQARSLYARYVGI